MEMLFPRDPTRVFVRPVTDTWSQRCDRRQVRSSDQRVAFNGTPRRAEAPPIERGSAVDTLTATILVVILLVLVAPIIEIAVKRPKTFLEMTEDARAFAEAPPDEGVAKQSSPDLANAGDEPADDRRLPVTPADCRQRAEQPSHRRRRPRRGDTSRLGHLAVDI
jgi:hypothetical protein